MSGTQVGTEKTEPSFYSFFVCAPVCSVQLVDQSCCWSAEPLPCTAGRCSFIRPDLAFNALWRYMLVPDVFSLYRPTRRTRRQQKKLEEATAGPQKLCVATSISAFLGNVPAATHRLLMTTLLFRPATQQITSQRDYSPKCTLNRLNISPNSNISNSLKQTSGWVTRPSTFPAQNHSRSTKKSQWNSFSRTAADNGLGWRMSRRFHLTRPRLVSRKAWLTTWTKKWPVSK